MLPDPPVTTATPPAHWAFLSETLLGDEFML
jgi:hypothetical protein